MKNPQSTPLPEKALTVASSRPEVAIPYLPRPERTPATKVRTRNKDRVPRACRNCHKRKVKCSGDYPRCNFCEKVNKPCVYEATRKDRLATATERNDQLAALLTELSGRVSDDDRVKIEGALNDSDNEYESLPQPAESSRRPSSSQTSPLSTIYPLDADLISPTYDQSFVPRPHDSSNAVESLTADAALFAGAAEPIYLGQICEAQWLRHLKARLQRRGSKSIMTPSPISETTFYSDHHGIQLLHRDNPFHLPPEQIAATLFQCYHQTIHLTFPIMSVNVDDQLRLYYESMRDGQPVTFSHRWYAIVNLIFAIGSRFSRLIHAEWQVDTIDENLYLSRAFQLLGLTETAIVLGDTDLPLIEATGLLALYYTVIGQVDRAWATVGTAVRLAVGIGLHTRSQASTLPQQRDIMIKTWWNVYNLDSLLSTITGRLSMLRIEDITTPLPSEVSETTPQTGLGPILSFPDAQIKYASIARKVLSSLYTEQRAARPWAQVHTIIGALMSELNEWTSEAVPDGREAWQDSTHYNMHQVLLKKQCCRMRILITRPALRRIELCVENQTEDFTPLDVEVAEVCVQSAQEAATLLPDEIDLKAMYEKGPWWVITHNIMQASTVLLIAISCRKHFEALYAPTISSLRKLVMWLRYMRHSNETAKRGYQVLYDIVKAPNLQDQFMWADIANLFPDEEPRPEISPHQQGAEHAYNWPPGNTQGMTFQGDQFEFH